MTEFVNYPFKPGIEEMIRKSIREGKVVVFPTETYYAIGGNAFHPALVERIFHVKKREPHKPLLSLITLEWLGILIAEDPSPYESLIKAFWPGPLTLIFKAKPRISPFLRGPQNTIALRYSNSEIVNTLLELAKRPLIGTSANLSGQSGCRTAQEAYAQLGDSIDWLIDGGATPGEQASTILNLTSSPFQIERQGVIEEDQLKPFINDFLHQKKPGYVQHKI
ncbi:L-threonylcarbamoyladenylate synthase [Deltaproteobacteria bacterium TL4]